MHSINRWYRRSPIARSVGGIFMSLSVVTWTMGSLLMTVVPTTALANTHVHKLHLGEQQPPGSNENPTLPNSCGLDIALVLDVSASINSTELGQMKSAFTSFVTDLAPTPSMFSVSDFAITGSVVSPFTASASDTNTAITGIVTGGLGTNFEDGLAKAYSTFDPRADKPNVIVFASDGDPNRKGTTGTIVTPTVAENAAIVEANAIKAAGTRIVTLGIGDNLNSANLIALSSPDAYYTADNFADVGPALAELALDLCGGTVTVQKMIDTDGNPDTAAVAGSSDWSFVIGGNATTTDETGKTPAVELSQGSYSITEPAAEGYDLQSASCTNQDQEVVGAPGEGGVTGVTVGPLDIVSCTFTNVPNTGTIHVVKEVVDSDASPADFSFYVDEGPNTSFEADGTNDVIVSTHSTHDITEKPDDAYTTTYDGCADITVAPGGEATCTITNTAIPQGSPYCGDSVVNQEWEQCDAGVNGSDSCTAQCQLPSNACTEDVFARVNVANVQNWGTGDVTDTVYLGGSGNPIPQGTWFPVKLGGSVITDPAISGYEDVQGLAVARSASGVMVLLHGSHPADGDESDGPDKEHADGTVEFWNTSASSITNATGQNKPENPSNGTKTLAAGNDETWLTSGVSNFWFTVTSADDAYTTGYTAPVCEPEAPACTPNDQLVIVSDTQTTKDGNATVLVDGTGMHPEINDRWTAAIDSGAKWIWGEDTYARDINLTETFVRHFTINGNPTDGSSLDIAADNGYVVTVNGQDITCADPEEFNYQTPGTVEDEVTHDGQDTCSVPTSALHTGDNYITFAVNNIAQDGVEAPGNPAGLMYKLTITSETCTNQSCEAGVNLLKNPSFEANTVTPGSWDIFPSGSSPLDWLVSWLNPSGAPEVANAEIQSDNIFSGITASNGTQWTELDSDWYGPSNPGQGPGSVSLLQSIPTVAGKTYQVSFDFRPRPDTAAGQNALLATYDGVTGATASGSAGDPWTTHTYTFVATSSVTNIAFADAGTPNDSLGTLLDNTSVMCQPTQTPPGDTSELSLMKDVDDATPDDNQQITYTLTVHNAGPDAATNVVVTDVLPSGVSYVSSSASAGTYDNGTHEWTIPSIGDDSDATLTIVVQIGGDESGEIITNSASITESDNADTDSENDADSVSLTVNDDEGDGPGSDATPTCDVLDHHIQSGVCVPNDGPGGGGGGNGSPNLGVSGGGGGGNGGLVLGASTDINAPLCSTPLLHTYLKRGLNNDPEEVKKLQQFLNDHLGLHIPVTGFFGPLTWAGVNAFQVKYWEDVLNPWIGHGLGSNHTPTGYVYRTTQRKINLIYCALLNIPMPDLSDEN